MSYKERLKEVIKKAKNIEQVLLHTGVMEEDDEVNIRHYIDMLELNRSLISEDGATKDDHDKIEGIVDKLDVIFEKYAERARESFNESFDKILEGLERMYARYTRQR